MIVYHYSEFNKWPKIQKAQELSPLSLQSLHREINDDRAFVRATFALLRPAPKEWTDNSFFPTLWDYFQGTRGQLLLEVDVDPRKILVGDAGYIEGYLYREHHKELKMPHCYTITDPYIAFQRYQDSLITFEEYEMKLLHYIVPEVQIRFPVSLDHVTISPIQPLIESDLNKFGVNNPLLEPVPSIVRMQTELRPWLEHYRSINPNLETAVHVYQSIRSKEV